MTRKCKTCYYYSTSHWCHWLGKIRNPKQNECEDGYCSKDKANIFPSY